MYMKIAVSSALVMFCLSCSTRTLPQSARSKHFATVSSHLDLGGEVYLYVDIDGDIEKATTLINAVLSDLDDVPESIDATRIARELGLMDATAVGLSSRREKERYVNKMFVRIPGGRSGLLSVFGREAHPFEVLRLAPPATDLLLEQDVNMKIILDLVESLWVDLLGPDDAERRLERLHQPLPLMGMSIKQIVDRLDTKVMLIARIDESSSFTIPDIRTPIPMIHLTLSIDGLGVLFEPLQRILEHSPLHRITVDDRWETIETVVSLSDDLPHLLPVIRRDRHTDRLYVSTGPQHLADCLDERTSITADPTFRAVTRGLPLKKGNSLYYVSPDALRRLDDIVGSVLSEQKTTRFLKPLISQLLPRTDAGEAGVAVNTNDGIYVETRSACSHKTTILQGIYFNPLTVGILASTAVSSFSRYRDRLFGSPDDEYASTATGDARSYVNLCYWSAVQYFEANGTLPRSTEWTPVAPPTPDGYAPSDANWEHPAWTALGFGIYHQHLHQYRFVNDNDGFSCQARGDEAGNGILSRFSRSGRITENEDGVPLIEDLGDLRDRHLDD